MLIWLEVQQTRLVLENLLSYAFVSLNFFCESSFFKPYCLMLFIDITFMILRFLPFHLSSAYLPNCFGCDCQHEFVFCLFWLSLNFLKSFFAFSMCTRLYLHFRIRIKIQYMALKNDVSFYKVQCIFIVYCLPFICCKFCFLSSLFISHII